MFGAGFDVRVGLGPATSVIGTVNPDFAQVEQVDFLRRNGGCQSWPRLATLKGSPYR
jgi:hypothetical protein